MANRPNISSVVDPDIAGYIEEERQKKGLNKSSIINEMLKELRSLKLGEKKEINHDIIKKEEPKIESKQIIEKKEEPKIEKSEVKYNVTVPKIEVKKMAENISEYDFKRLTEKMDDLHRKIPQIDQVCKDGECLKTDMGNLRKEIEEIKGVVKKPEEKFIKCSGKNGCGEEVLKPGMGFCPNCGRKLTWKKVEE